MVTIDLASVPPPPPPENHVFPSKFFTPRQITVRILGHRVILTQFFSKDSNVL